VFPGDRNRVRVLSPEVNAWMISSAPPQVSGMTSTPDTHSVDSRGMEMAAQIKRSTSSLTSVAARLSFSSSRVDEFTAAPLAMSTTRIDLATSKTGEIRSFQIGIAILMAPESCNHDASIRF